MKTWFRLYHDIIERPAILSLAPACRWFYVALLAVASERGESGSLPTEDVLAINLGTTEVFARELVNVLIRVGLLHRQGDSQRLFVTGWNDENGPGRHSHREARPLRQQHDRKPVESDQKTKTKLSAIHAIYRLMPEPWLPEADSEVVKQLAVYSAASVLYGLEATVRKFDGRPVFGRGVATYWLNVTRVREISSSCI